MQTPNFAAQRRKNVRPLTDVFRQLKPHRSTVGSQDQYSFLIKQTSAAEIKPIKRNSNSPQSSSGFVDQLVHPYQNNLTKVQSKTTLFESVRRPSRILKPLLSAHTLPSSVATSPKLSSNNNKQNLNRKQSSSQIQNALTVISKAKTLAQEYPANEDIGSIISREISEIAQLLQQIRKECSGSPKSNGGIEDLNRNFTSTKKLPDMEPTSTLGILNTLTKGREELEQIKMKLGDHPIACKTESATSSPRGSAFSKTSKYQNFIERVENSLSEKDRFYKGFKEKIPKS